MRRLKERTGLGYGRLAAQTHDSRSSWERFLNGKQLPTTVAVGEFAAAMGGTYGVHVRPAGKSYRGDGPGRGSGSGSRPESRPRSGRGPKRPAPVQVGAEGELTPPESPPDRPSGPSGRWRLSPS
ncbi:helix-turn-helix transcriptional regulator [Streptomyces aureus]|uniref:helix-turn-helix domain-containing protein n=1 Tax=Streptomyces aureus TaxID=193461 RepID=UPI003158DD3E